MWQRAVQDCITDDTLCNYAIMTKVLTEACITGGIILTGGRSAARAHCAPVRCMPHASNIDCCWWDRPAAVTGSSNTPTSITINTQLTDAFGYLVLCNTIITLGHKKPWSNSWSLGDVASTQKPAVMRATTLFFPLAEHILNDDATYDIAKYATI